MTILARYIAMRFLRYWLACLAGLLGLILISALLGNVNDAIQSLDAFLTFWLETIRSIPDLLEILLPMTVLLATVFTFAGLSRTSELVAMKTAGMGYRKLMLPLFAVLVLVTAVAYLNQNYLYNLLHDGEENRAADARHQWRDLGGSLVYVDRVDSISRAVLNASIFRWQAAPFRLAQVTVLPQGNHAAEDAWTFRGVRVREKQPGDLWTLNAVPEVQVPDVGFPDMFKPREMDAHHLPVSDLYQEIAVRKSRSQPTEAHELELLRKLAVVTAPLVMVLIGTPLSQFHFRGGRVASEVLVTLLVGLVFMIASEILFILGKGGFLPPYVAALGVNAVFAGIGLGLFRFQR
jgi:lipopolysaccharide export system permease protein